MRMPFLLARLIMLGPSFAIFAAPFTAIRAFADEGGASQIPHIHEEGRGLEGLPILLVICALIIAVGLAFGIGRRIRK